VHDWKNIGFTREKNKEGKSNSGSGSCPRQGDSIPLVTTGIFGDKGYKSKTS